MPLSRITTPQYKWTFPQSESNQKRNPIQKWRKGRDCCDVSATKIKTQEIFTDTKCMRTAGECVRGSRKIPSQALPLNVDGVFDNNRIVNYKQYLQRRCKTIYQNTFSKCCDMSSNKCTSNKCNVTYKPNNKKFSTQGAVSSSARLLRLKNNALNLNKKTTKGVFKTNICGGVLKKKKNICKKKKISRYGCCIYKDSTLLCPPP